MALRLVPTPAPAPQGPGLRHEDRRLAEQAGEAVDALRGKWKVALVVGMARGVTRRARLHECLPEVSKKALTECLRGLERDGVVERRVFAEVPVRVEYRLTPLGWRLTEAIVTLADWSAARERSTSGAPGPLAA